MNNRPDLFEVPDGWYRSEYDGGDYDQKARLQGDSRSPLCFAIKNHLCVGREWEYSLPSCQWKSKPDGYETVGHFVFLGELTFICGLNGPHNDWDDCLELV